MGMVIFCHFKTAAIFVYPLYVMLLWTSHSFSCVPCMFCDIPPVIYTLWHKNFGHETLRQ